MEKDERIKTAELSVSAAEENVRKAKKTLDAAYEKLSKAYEEVFEENVCKKGERFVCKNRRIDGFYKGFRFAHGSIDLIWCPAKKDGTMSKVEHYDYRPDLIIEEFLEKRQ